ncbi:MAG: UDP-3-O-(3-hydroxymyristoyl)glucosamine N-acyltransferase [bacterium]|nr:UDP-3-O-(3-hydroxymyristoyl)glucosamine N-acyltransferase [bacterium]
MGLSIEPKQFTLSELAAALGEQFEGNPDLLISGVAGIKEAGRGQISFLSNGRYLHFLERTEASALVVAAGVDTKGIPAIRSENPYLSFLMIVRLFSQPLRHRYPAGVHQTAVIGEGTVFGEGCHIGANTYIGEQARIGKNVVLTPGVVLLDRVVIGDNCILFPNVVVREACRLAERVIIHSGSVIGSDGYGYAHDGKVHHKIPQIGIVVIEDDVEIGANVAIDRAATGITRIGRGCKIDNLVHIAHNVEIDEYCLIVGQVGISGSTHIGPNCVIGGQAGLAGHIVIGEGVKIGAQSGVTKSIPSNVCVSGYPARPHDQSMRQSAMLSKLPELMKRVKDLEEKLAECANAPNDEKRGSK